MIQDSPRAPVLGLFVGGKGRRMGGAAKALLPAPGSGEPLGARLLRLAEAAGLPVVLIGDARASDLPPSAATLLGLHDRPAGIGPLGGLAALLAHADPRPALALACDMPYLDAELLKKLAYDPRPAAVLAPRDRATGKWQALFARYDPRLVRPALEATLAAGERSFQQLFARLPCTELLLDDAEHAQLRDWDYPADIEP